MASRDEFSSNQSSGTPEAPDRLPSENVESSPPRYLSLSSSFETLDQPTSSGTISQDNGGMPYSVPVNCPPFVPRGFFDSVMPNPMIGQQNPLMSAEMPLIQGPVVYQSPMCPPAMNYGNGFLQPQMVPAPPVRGNYPRPSLPFAGGGLGALHGTGAPHIIYVPVFPLPAPMMFELPMENVPTRFPFAPVAGPRRLWIDVHACQKVNFAETAVSVVIQVLHAPQDFEIRADMFHASVESPSGKMIECRVRESDTYILNTFAGSFIAEEETGKYRVDVTMTIPPHKLEQYRNLFENADGTIRIYKVLVISKNYGWDSQRNCVRLRCEYGISGLDRPGAEVVETSGPEEPHPPAAAGVSGVKSKLWGLTCDLRNNNLFYTDRGADVVRCMDPKGNIVLEFGQNRLLPENELLKRPCGIEFDGVRNRLIICDRDNHRVCFFTLDGKFISSFGQRGQANGCFEFPWDVAVSPNGTIAVSDSKNRRVQFFDTNGNYMFKCTAFAMSPHQSQTEFYNPRGLCFDKSGRDLFVTDFKLNSVIRILTDSKGWRGKKILAQDSLGHPQGITMDNAGKLLVTDSLHDCIPYITKKGQRFSTIRTVAGQPLSFPVNVTTMAGGSVAVLNGDGTIFIF